MKKMILFFALLACVVAIGDVRGQGEISLEDWCKTGGHTWDNGTCYVVNGWLIDQLNIDADESLVINDYFEIDHGSSIDNSGKIIVRGLMINYGRIDIDEGGVLINLGLFRNVWPDTLGYDGCRPGDINNYGIIRNIGYFANAYFDIRPDVHCLGVINNYQQAAFYNVRTLRSDGYDFNNLGVFYYWSCGGSKIVTSLRFYTEIGGTHIEIDICDYMPMISMN